MISLRLSFAQENEKLLVANAVRTSDATQIESQKENQNNVLFDRHSNCHSMNHEHDTKTFNCSNVTRVLRLGHLCSSEWCRCHAILSENDDEFNKNEDFRQFFPTIGGTQIDAGM